VSVQPLAWVALVPFLLALRRASLAQALGLGWVWTIAAAYTVGNWFAPSVSAYYRQPILVGVAFFVGVSSFMAAPYYMAFAAAYRTLARRSRTSTPVLVAAAWVASELGRHLLAGNPWALFGYSQMGLAPMIQIADVTGVYGVSFALVAVNAALAELIARRHAPAARSGALVAATVALGVVAYGEYRIATMSTAPHDARAMSVAMIQGNLDVGSQWREELYGRNLDTYLRLTSQALAESRPQVVFWPEATLTFFLENEPLYRKAIAHVLAPSRAQLVVGGPRSVGNPARTYFNSIFLLAPDGEILATYDKQRLVPFAERFPFGSVALLRRHFARVREFTPGEPSAPLPTVVGPAGVTICNEAMFPEIAAARVRAGATFLVDPANDTWLTPKFSAQQFDIVRLRTVEQRRYLVRASTSGPSAIVDPLGNVPVRTKFMTRAAIAGTIYPSTTVTLYCRIGDLFAWACTAAAIIATLRRARATVA
jgi:apolipoprotein N-acyltransferase